ncbi:MAG: LysR substrate-binding domain-containing protein [Betaproteobacteria bacterium]
MSASTLPSLRQLRYLVELAARLNFRQAAQACFVTQSTLSAGIKELETQLGVQLVERDTRVVRVTPIGEEVVARARQLLASAQDLVAIAANAGEPLNGRLALGVIPTIAPFILPGVLPPLRARYPKLELHLREDLTDRLLERLRGGQLDIALIALPYDTQNLLVRELMQDEFWFVARDDDPHASEKAIAVKKLDTGQVLLLEEGHCLREHAIAACGNRRSNPESRIEATSLNTLMQMVEGGLGVTLLPELALKSGILKGTRLIARPFSSQVPTRTIALVTRTGSARQRDFDLLADFIIEHYRRLRGSAIPSRRPARRAA